MRQFPESAPYAPGNEASRQAADGIHHQLDGIRADVFDYIISSGAEGATGSEIADSLDILPYTAKPRCTELKDAGYIVDSHLLRKNSNDRNETVWVAVKNWPTGPWKGKEVDADERGLSGLAVFDDIFRRNPHLRNTFKMSEINTIREDLEKAAGLP